MKFKQNTQYSNPDLSDGEDSGFYCQQCKSAEYIYLGETAHCPNCCQVDSREKIEFLKKEEEREIESITDEDCPQCGSTNTKRLEGIWFTCRDCHNSFYAQAS